MRQTIDMGDGRIVDVETSLRALMEDLEATGRWTHRAALAYAAWLTAQAADVEKWEVEIAGERHRVTGWNHTLRLITAE